MKDEEERCDEKGDATSDVLSDIDVLQGIM